MNYFYLERNHRLLDKFMMYNLRIKVNECCKFCYSCRFWDEESARIEIYHQVLLRLEVLVTGCHYLAHPGNFYRTGKRVVGGFVELKLENDLARPLFRPDFPFRELHNRILKWLLKRMMQVVLFLPRGEEYRYITGVLQIKTHFLAMLTQYVVYSVTEVVLAPSVRK
jgi:hypothetical protein